MSIEFFETSSTAGGPDAVLSLLHDAGFTDAAYTFGSGVSTFSSASGIYGVNSFKVNNAYGDTKYFAVKDDERKTLYVYPGIEPTDTMEQDAGNYVCVIIANGVLSEQPGSGNKFSQLYNVTGGAVKTSFDTSEVLLTPLIDKDAQILKPFYISANRVCHNAKTVVTDSNGNSFTSLGNLFYINNQGSTSITATANDGSKVSSSDTLTVTSTPAQTETVDVYIGDSTTAIWDTAPAEKNWTTLISNADGVGRVNVAVVGAGFQNDAGKNAAFPAQVTTAIGKTQGKTVRRVFLVGLWNDQNYIQSDLSAEKTAMTKTADAIKSAWPGAQLLYIPEVAPQTDYSTSMVAKYSSTINQVYSLFEGKGFNVAHDWPDWMPDGKTNGYMHDTIHPNAKGMNVAAHKIREWVNTLSGTKITGEIPEWSE